MPTIGRVWVAVAGWAEKNQSDTLLLILMVERVSPARALSANE